VRRRRKPLGQQAVQPTKCPVRPCVSPLRAKCMRSRKRDATE
jgi:hypothetical protein